MGQITKLALEGGITRGQPLCDRCFMAVKVFPLLRYLIVGVVMGAVVSGNSAPYLNYSKRLKQGCDVITMMQRTVPERTREPVVTKS